jgi:selenide,water dikinase
MAALRGNEADPLAVKAAADSMERLNRRAAEKLCAFAGAGGHTGVSACTDVTGFGLTVHASEMAGGAHTLVIDGASLPLLPGALGFAESFYATAAGQRNRNYMEGKADVSALPPALQEIVFDPQTSGGLLIAAAPGIAQELCNAICRDDPVAAIIGEVTDREGAAVVFV